MFKVQEAARQMLTKSAEEVGRLSERLARVEAGPLRPARHGQGHHARDHRPPGPLLTRTNPRRDKTTVSTSPPQTTVTVELKA
jgi:hypothetical protein